MSTVTSKDSFQDKGSKFGYSQRRSVWSVFGEKYWIMQIIADDQHVFAMSRYEPISLNEPSTLFISIFKLNGKEGSNCSHKPLYFLAERPIDLDVR